MKKFPCPGLPHPLSAARRSLAILGLSLVLGLPPSTGAEEALSGPAIAQELRSFRQTASVLYIAAHPDDENSQLIAYLARGRGYRTGYLSLTRGDGGQNVLGPEFGETLGLIRTHELLAARRVDGGRQFFSRAIDFGFSKDYRETLGIWGREEVLGDIVRVIRTFRPDVIVTGFSTVPGGTHGHHTASGVLGLAAFKLAGDPKAYPEQLKYLQVWQPKRVCLSTRDGGGDNGIRMEINDTEAPPGDSFGEIASRSRAMHKSQGFGGFGGGRGGGVRYQSFRFLDGEPATKDLLDGVDTTWARFPGGAALQPAIDELVAKFSPTAPAASIPAVLSLRASLNELSKDPRLNRDALLNEKRFQLDHILQSCLGLKLVTEVTNAEVVPGETMHLHQTATVTANIPVKWLGVLYPGGAEPVGGELDLLPNTTVSREATQKLPPGTPISQPYWLRAEPSPGLFRVPWEGQIGTPENSSIFALEQVFRVGDQVVILRDEPVQLTNHLKVAIQRRLEVIPPVSLAFPSGVELFAPGASREITIAATASRANAAGTIGLEAPTGWTIIPASRPLHLTSEGDQAKYTFKVTAPAVPGSGMLRARATVNGVVCSTGRKEVHYAHIPPLLLQAEASLKGVVLELATRGHEIGYLPGAGDSVAEALQQMGYSVTTLANADLTVERLKAFDAVVVGIRAFDTHRDLGGHLPDLFAYAEAGGNVVMQYNRVDGLTAAPLKLTISSDRVTDENSPVTFLAPDHPVLNTPNKITSADFAGWVQERGIYFPRQWDERFVPILAANDPGESPLRSGLLVAPYGKGHFVYTSLVWFRELPAGVPGAYRLFANLVSLGK